MKRIRTKTATVVDGGGGEPTVCPPTVIGKENLGHRDAQRHELQVPELITLADAPKFTATKQENLGHTDRVSFVDVAATKQESLVHESYIHAFASDITAKGDNWTDAAATTTNHGTDATLLVKEDTDPLGTSNKRTAWIKWDLTGIDPAGFAIGLGTVELTIAVSHNGILGAQTLTWAVQRFATDPFNEATQTWATQVDRTAVTSGTLSITQGAVEYYTVILSSVNANSLIGQWVILKLDNNAGVTNTTTFSILSKETAINLDRPKLTIDFTQ